MATMQSSALLIACMQLLVTAQTSMGMSLLQTVTSKNTGNMVEQEKPFLDGDFTRDSSNPLDAYEDEKKEESTTEAPDAPAPAPAPEPTAGKGEGKGAGKGDGKGAGKGNGKGKGKGDAKSASAVQVALAGASGDVSAKGNTIAKHLQAPATTAAAAPATEAKAQPAAKAKAEPAAATTAPAAATPVVATATVAPAVHALEHNATQSTSDATAGATTATPSVSAHSSSCVTRKDSRAVAWWAETAPEGSPCIFGVDARDEGSHCMFQDGEFGSNGWCWTSKDESAWGSCGNGCPLYGPPASLGSKIDSVAKVLGKISQKVDQLSGKTTLKASEASKDSNVPKAEESIKKPDATDAAKKPDAKKVIAKEAGPKKPVVEDAEKKSLIKK